MKKPCIFLFIFLMASSLVLAASTGKEPGAPSKDKQPSCKTCHADSQALLPQNHPPIGEMAKQACSTCHTPDTTGKAAPNPYSARIHRIHSGGKAKLDCTSCHALKPGKSFGLPGQKESLGKPTKEDMELLRQTFASWSSSDHLDALHAKRGVTCSSCHGAGLPVADDAVESERCLKCHGSREQLAVKTAPKIYPDRNPHKSHLGEIDCSVCHKAHSTSTTYCMNCHRKFDMTIPGGEKR